MFSGIIRSGGLKRHLLDVVVDDASSMEEVDAGEKEMEPFASFGLFDLDRDECGKVGPGNRQSTSELLGAAKTRASTDERTW